MCVRRAGLCKFDGSELRPIREQASSGLIGKRQFEPILWFRFFIRFSEFGINQRLV